MQHKATFPLQSLLAQGLQLHREGRFAEAQALYERILALDPRSFDALHLLGILAAQQRDLTRADRLLAQALEVDPSHAGAHSNRGNVLRELGQPTAALASYDRAIVIRPDYAEAQYNRAVVLQELAQFEAAIAGYDATIALQPGHADAHNNRGTALAALMRFDTAIASYDRAIALRPQYAQAHGNRGLALQKLGRLEEAVSCFERAIALKPDDAEAHHNRALALQELGRLDDAVAVYDRAIVLKPDYADAFRNRGAALHRLMRLEAAVASYDRALAIRADDAEAYYNRGTALQELAQPARAEADYRAALRIDPEFARARWALAFVALSPLLTADDDPEPRRQALARALDDLDRWFTGSRLDKAHEAVGSGRPFYLAYQELDNRPLLEKYGALCVRLMSHWQQSRGIEACALSTQGKIRIGIVSDHLRNHSVWNAIVRGLVSTLDLSRFELHVFYLGTVIDGETETARSLATSFVQGGRSLAQWAEAIAARRIEALVYPEIGMHALTTQLASMRLAPVQMAMWGHPETTGLPTIDYFVSGDDLEPQDADRHYSERLIRLPHLGCSCSPQRPPAAAPLIEGLDSLPAGPLLLCPGTTFKYQPQHDRVLAKIARRLGSCRFVFFAQQPQWTAILGERLRREFEASGLRFDDHVVFVPWLGRAEFAGLMRRADVYLDTIGFSGFNTAMQAVDCGLPIVTREGRFMRGRLASAILRRMGMGELVATSEDGYVGLAVRLAADADYREQVRAAMASRKAVLFEDPAPMRALEGRLIDICRPSGRDRPGGVDLR